MCSIIMFITMLYNERVTRDEINYIKELVANCRDIRKKIPTRVD